MGIGSRLPKYNELMWPTLRAITESGGSATIQEIATKVIELQGYSEEQQSVLHKDGPATEIEYRLAWARTYLKGVEAINNSRRGIWSITEKGRSLIEQEVWKIPSQYKKSIYEKRKRDSAETAQPETLEGDPEQEVASWKDQVLDALLSLSADAFERLSSRLLREANFTNMKVIGRSGDGGIDGSGLYRLSLVSFPIYFQSKRWKGSVGSKEVRDFRGAMAGRGDRGLLITTATFTAEAKREASRDGAPPVDLIDGDQLCDLLKEYGLGVTVRSTETVALDKGFFSDI
ncbi:MAG: restriction endonuclease [Actinomycetota bacterium]